MATLVEYTGGIFSSVPPHDLENGWTRRPDPDKLRFLIHLIQMHGQKITYANFNSWLAHLAAQHVPDGQAVFAGEECGSNKGLAKYLGIEPYGQRGSDVDCCGHPYMKPGGVQRGHCVERLHRFAPDEWTAALLRAPNLDIQKAMYCHVLEVLADKGEYDFSLFTPVMPAAAEEVSTSV